jgi:hypothetical protein
MRSHTNLKKMKNKDLYLYGVGVLLCMCHSGAGFLCVHYSTVLG